MATQGPSPQQVGAGSALIASVLLPLALAFAGHWYSQALKERETQAKFVELAAGILREPPRGDTTVAIRTWATGILTRYSGVPMNDATIEALQTEVQLPIAEVQSDAPRADRAAALERAAFEALLAGDVDAGINAFQQAERVYPEYHSVYEIARYLSRERAAFADANMRRVIFRRLLNDYRWGVPQDIVEKLRAAAAE